MARKKSATKRLLILLGVLVGLLIIVAVVASTTDLFGGGDKGIAVEVSEVDFRNVTQVVTASGKVQPEVEVKISPDVSGEIIALPVKEGDEVVQGAVLARIKPDFYQAQVEQASASVLQAKANESQRKADLLNAEWELGRQRTLSEKNLISESDFQAAQTRFATATAGHEAASYAVQAAQARYRESRENLGKTVIYSPMDGTVSKLNVEYGERVVGTSQMTGTEMMRVAQLDRMELEVDVNENDVVNVTVGDSASVEIDAYPARTFRGIVTEIANSARTSAAGTQEQVTNFPVKIRIENASGTSGSRASAGNVLATSEEVPGTAKPAANFRPGMSGTVDIFTQTIMDAVAVEIQAVTVRDFNEIKREEQRKARRGNKADSTEVVEIPNEEDLRRVVFVNESGKAKMVEVETGISDETHIVIISGLSGGENAIIGPFRAVSRTLEPDDTVREEDPRRNLDRSGA